MKKRYCVFAFAFLFEFGAVLARADTCNGFTYNLVSNCGFESGDFEAWTGETTTSFQSGVDQLSPYSGRYAAYLGAVGLPTTLTQTVATTIGTVYLVEFALMNDTSPSLGNTNSFSVEFAGNPLFSETGTIAGDYQLYSFLGTASTNTTALSFLSRNDAGFFNLDSISVTVSTPEAPSWVLIGVGLALLGVFFLHPDRINAA